MKTDMAHALCIALTSFFFLSAVLSPTEGKCAGRWAIHACWGGNGKRSGPTMDMAPRPSLLRQLLLRNRPVFEPAFSGSLDEEADTEPTEDLGSPSSFNAALSEYHVRPASPPVSRLASLLRTLRTLQKENDALP